MARRDPLGPVGKRGASRRLIRDTINHQTVGKTPQSAITVAPIMTAIENKWLADRLRKLAAVEALAGAHSVAVEHLFRAQAIEAGRDHWRSLSGPLEVPTE